MKKLNDSPNHPLRWIDENRTVGQFYNSRDKTYHLAEYIPYVGKPEKYLCGKTGNFSISRCESVRKKCEKCFNELLLEPSERVSEHPK